MFSSNNSLNQLILGDNLTILQKIKSETVDLIYLDPPFFSNKNYEIVWGDAGEIRSFQDRWAGGVDHYIVWLKERVIEMHRVLKSTGSIFLHCDWHANSYIRVYILDKIFGANNYRNEIIWSYRRYTAVSKKYQNLHDTIFWYTKGNSYTFNEDREEYGENSGKLDSHYKQDEDGKWYRWQKRKNMEPYKIYLSEGKRSGDVWEIPIINASAKERIGYPTQKPFALLERIIKSTTNENDIVLDPFVGGGTTIAVADKLNRKWIGIDQSVQAVKVSELRLHQQTDLFTSIYANSYSLHLYKYDYDTLRNKDPFEFENWIIGQFGGTGNVKQRNDFGMDGKMHDNTPIQVKRSENIGRNVIDNFLSAVKRYDKKLFEKHVSAKTSVGYIIAFSFSKGAVQEVARLANDEGINIQLITVDSIIPISKKPNITINVSETSRDANGSREIVLLATAESDAAIEFFSWDFDYDPEKGFKAAVMLDRDGKQTVNFTPGIHNVAVKVVDNDGLESLEVIKIKVNGTVEKL
ncbi:MAG: site-specific DNA-methyltransferase [Dysgonamonadaceae bacterium]|jgi:DNA modification methylase|nr:site-specific DNA-methyltransferase [Dysgonamonadaceae bacterium]